MIARAPAAPLPGALSHRAVSCRLFRPRQPSRQRSQISGADPEARKPLRHRRLLATPAAAASAAAGDKGGMAPAGQQQQEEGAHVAVITTLGCPYCKKVKAALQAADVPFAEYDLGEQLEVLAKVKAASGQSTVPQVFVGGQLLGGASEVVPLLQSGSLQQLLAGTSAPPLPAELAAVLGSVAAASAAGQAAAGAADSAELAASRQLAAELQAALGGPARIFTLRAAVEWAQQARGLSEAAAAEALGRLQAAQLLTLAGARPAGPGAGAQPADVPITPELAASQPQLPLRMVADAPQPAQWSEPLNGQFAWFGPARPAAQVAEDLRGRMLRLYDRYLAEGGKKVDYEALKKDPEWAQFVAASAELQKVDLSQLASREERMAFLINLYNTLVVHALVVFGPADGTLGRLRWFDSISYWLGGQRWSSNDVEHGALRGNAPSPASLFSLLGRPQWAGRTFKAGDPRAALAIQPVDPRIHFALNCGAASCPPIRTYTPDKLEFGLSAAANAFCASEVAVDKAAGELELSMILKWYGPDFGTKAQLLAFLAQHLPEGPAADLRELLASRPVEDIKLRFRPYDWSVNSAAE